MHEDAVYESQSPATWFRFAAIASVVWYLLGCASYLYQVTVDPATLPPGQREMMEAAPTWMFAAFAIAVWVGLAGAIMLAMRKSVAVPLLLLSLAATLVQFSAYFLNPPLRATMSAGGLLLPTLILGVTAIVVRFASRARQHGWLGGR